MIPIKTQGRIMGASFTKNEQKAIDMEIAKQLAVIERKHELELDAMTLYVLMVKYGWKEKRLRQFWDAFRKAHRDLIRRYELAQSMGEDAWVCQRKLLEAGIDIATWDREFDTKQEESKP